MHVGGSHGGAEQERVNRKQKEYRKGQGEYGKY